MKERLTKELKEEREKAIRRNILEEKLDRDEELTKDEELELELLIKEENFLFESKQDLTKEELKIINELTNKKLNKDNLEDIILEMLEELRESMELSESINKDEVEELELIIAKLGNIKDKIEELESKDDIEHKAKKLLKMRDEIQEYAYLNDLKGLLKLKEAIKDIEIVDDEVWLQNTRIAKITNINDVTIDYDGINDDIPLDNNYVRVYVEFEKPGMSGKSITYNPFQRLLEKDDFKGFDYVIDRM